MRRPFIIDIAINCALAYAGTTSVLHALTYFDLQSIIAAILLPFICAVSIVSTYLDMRCYLK